MSRRSVLRLTSVSPASLVFSPRPAAWSISLRRYALSGAATESKKPAASPYTSVQPIESPPSATMARSTSGPLKRYDNLIASGVLLNDDHQRSIVTRLQQMHDRLRTYHPPPVPEEIPRSAAGGGNFLSRLFKSKPEPYEANLENTMTIPEGTPKGLYLYGTVGTGKSMLMDLFHSTLPPQFIDSRRRVHFHAFMIDVHKRNHRYKVQFGETGDRMGEVARDLAREARVLCFDEFQVTDITDAMILRNLLERLMGYGVVCVMTSNRHPDDLYKNGLQRKSFLPCIQLIKDQFEIADLTGDDYRQVPGSLQKVYYDATDPADASEFRKQFNAKTAKAEVVAGRKVEIWGRKLAVPESSTDVAWFDFDSLCGKNLGAADYIEVTKAFKTIFVDAAPKMDLDTKDRARRFITFIDACYESRTKLYMSTAAPMLELFSGESESTRFYSDHQRSLSEDLQLTDQEAVTSPIFTGEEEVFAFKRCVSRLSEMGGTKWSAFQEVADQ